MRKRKLWITVIAIVVGVPLALFVVVRVALPPERLRALLVPRLEAALGRPVQVAGLHVSTLPLAVRVDGVRVASSPGFASPALLELGSLRFDLQLLPLFARRIVVRSVVIETPQVWLEQRADSTWNFAPAPAAAGAPRQPAETGTPFALTVQSLRVQGGTVHLWSAPMNVELVAPLAAELRFNADRALRDVRLSGWLESAPLSGGERGLLHALRDARLRVEPQVRIDLPDSSARIEKLHLLFDEAALDLEGEARATKAGPEMHLRTQSGELDLAKLLAAVPRSLLVGMEKLQASGQAKIEAKIDRLPGAPLVSRGKLELQNGAFQFPDLPEKVSQVTAHITWSGDSLRLDEVSARLGNAPLRLSGLVLSAFPGQQARYDLRLAAQLDLASLARFAPLPPGTSLAGHAALDLRARGRAARPDSVYLEGPITLTQVVVKTPLLLQPVGIDASLHGAGERVTIDRMTLRAGESDLDFTGTLRPALPPRRPALELLARGKKLDLNALLPQTPIGAAPGTSTGAAPAAQAPAPLLPPVDVSVTILVGEVHAQDFVLRGLRGSLRSDGTTGTGKLHAEGGKLQLLEATALESDLEIHGTEVRLTKVLGRAYTGALTGSILVGLEKPEAPRFDVQVHADRLDADAFLGSLTPLRGVLRGTLDLQSSWKGTGPTPQSIRSSLTADGKGSTSNGSIEGLAILDELSKYLQLPNIKKIPFRDLAGHFDVQQGRVHFSELALHGGEEDIGVHGSVGLDGGLDLNLSLQLSEELSKRYVRGQIASSLSTLLADPSGRLAFDFKVGGTYRAPKLAADLDATRARAGLKSLGQAGLQRLLGNFAQPGAKGDTTSGSAAPKGAAAVKDVGRKLGGRLQDLLRGSTPADSAKKRATPPNSARPDSARKR